MVAVDVDDSEVAPSDSFMANAYKKQRAQSLRLTFNSLILPLYPPPRDPTLGATTSPITSHPATIHLAGANFLSNSFHSTTVIVYPVGSVVAVQLTLCSTVCTVIFEMIKPSTGNLL